MRGGFDCNSDRVSSSTSWELPGSVADESSTRPSNNSASPGTYELPVCVKFKKECDSAKQIVTAVGTRELRQTRPSHARIRPTLNAPANQLIATRTNAALTRSPPPVSVPSNGAIHRNRINPTGRQRRCPKSQN